MTYIRLILFSLRQLSAIGVWQAGAELDGSEELRRRVLRHRRLQHAASQALRAKLREDFGSRADTETVVH